MLEAHAAYLVGDVDAAAERLSLGRIRYDDGSEIPLRTTTVLHRSEGDWKIVQTMASVPVPEDLLEPGSPIAEARSTGFS